MTIIFAICAYSVFLPLVSCEDSKKSGNDQKISPEEVVHVRGLSEGPHWDVRTQKLYFVQIWKQLIYSYNPATGEIFHAYIKNGPVSVVSTIKDTPGKLLVGSGTDIALVTWDGESNNDNPEIKVLLNDMEKGEKGYRFNDGKVDALGRLWAGTMCQLKHKNIPKVGTLYLVEDDVNGKLNIETKISSVSISNGLDWQKDNKVFYYTDTLTDKVFTYDFDISSSNITNKRVLVDVKEKGFIGDPDGMTIDTDGNLWVALVHGSKVLHVDSKSGNILKEIDFPVKMVTSVAFGGPNLDILYVTTATYDFPDKIVDENGGPIFALKNLGVKGFPPHLFKLNNNYE
ncbi:regucalcin-like [Belonocnema kinseyi]|uniref:regucalcin-like n=1 Tax=Belonocnema kinseyi TaxID=2817044 RepID=UPI00143CDCA9|nr:regucalcin-like [Belonocnema kinseyi]